MAVSDAICAARGFTGDSAAGFVTTTGNASVMRMRVVTLGGASGAGAVSDCDCAKAEPIDITTSASKMMTVVRATNASAVKERDERRGSVGKDDDCCDIVTKVLRFIGTIATFS